MLNQYETVIILTPLLSDEQMKEAVAKYRKFMEDNGAEIVHVDNWGLRKLAYTIANKNNGFYNLIEFKADGDFIQKLEVEYKRDERILRFLTIALDKHSVYYNDRKRKGELGAPKRKTKLEKEAN